MTSEEAQRLIQQGEGQRVEFKQTFAEADDAIRSLCAFANADGGTVLIGVTDAGELVEPCAGKKTLEDFVNRLKSNTAPTITPRIYDLALANGKIFTLTVDRATSGQVFSAFGHYKIRVGKANIDMPPEQMRARFLEGQPDWSEERDLPRFEVGCAGVGKSQAAAEPNFRVKQASGENVADLEWRIRGRFVSKWRQASGSALDRTSFIPALSLPQPSYEDQRVGGNEIGFEIRFHWRGQVRHEIHRWQTPQRAPLTLTDWEIGEKILPPLYFEEPGEVGVTWA